MINWAKVSAGQMQIFSEGRPRSLAVLTISELLALFADKALVSPLNKYFLLLLLFLLLCKSQFWKWIFEKKGLKGRIEKNVLK